MFSTTQSVPELVNLQPGDLCETVSLVTLREAETRDSVSVAELPYGTALKVLEIGEGHRIKVKSENAGIGWISSRTRMNEPLVVNTSNINSVIEGFEAGEHEVTAPATMRQGEGFDSALLAELKPGTTIKIVEMGTENTRRAKVQVQDIGEGWISVCTKSGKALLKKVAKVRVIQLSARQRAALRLESPLTILVTSMGGNELASYRLSPKKCLGDLRKALANDLGTPALALVVATTGQLLDESSNGQRLSEVFKEACRQD